MSRRRPTKTGAPATGCARVNLDAQHGKCQVVAGAEFRVWLKARPSHDLPSVQSGQGEAAQAGVELAERVIERGEHGAVFAAAEADQPGAGVLHVQVAEGIFDVAVTPCTHWREHRPGSGRFKRYFAGSGPRQGGFKAP